MSHRVWLRQNYSGDPAEDVDTDPVLAERNLVLPLFWCSIFASSDIHMVTTQQEDVDANDTVMAVCDVAYPVLLTTTDQARERTLERKQMLFDYLPLSLEPHFEEWLLLLAGAEAPYVVVDPEEVWAMSWPGMYDRELAACVRAFEQNRREDWAVLINQTVSMRYDPPTQHLTFIEQNTDLVPLDLRGGRCMRPVPWAE